MRAMGPGIVCTKCGSIDHRVLDSRPWSNGRIRRRRECDLCGTRWTTSEIIVDANEPHMRHDEPYETVVIYIPKRLADALKYAGGPTKALRGILEAIAISDDKECA